MSALPKEYTWLHNEMAPRLLVEAIDLFGVREIPGAQSNPTIIQWAKNLGGWMASWFKNDDIPWCGLFVAECCRRAGLPVVKEPLRALAWKDWGFPAGTPMLGDVLVFAREGGGHVGIYVGEDRDCYHVLGGNQGNAVSITRIVKARLVCARRTPWKIAEPKTVRVVKLAAGGAISTNEA